MFTALKYHAIDYLYEKMARQRFSFECLSINIPSCLYQDKNYYHEGSFADDKYRRPWTRDLYIEDELVFTDNLAQYAKQLPSLPALLNRLSVFQVQDPLLNSKGENITEEDIFRNCFTFEMKVMPQAKEKEGYEDFCTNDTSLYPEELEVPLTPPCRSEKHTNVLYAELQSEPISPFSKSVLITESTKQSLEGSVWQSEKYQNPMSTFLLAAESAVAPDTSGTEDPFGSPVYSENASFENNAMEDSIQSETDKLVHFGNQAEEKGDQVQPMNCQVVPVEPNRMPGGRQTAPFEPPRKRTDDFDLLSSFIMLRSKHLNTPSEETNNLVDVQDEVLDAKEESPVFENQGSPVLVNTKVLSEKEPKENEVVFIQIKASESQFQAYHILEATVAPVLKELTSLGTYNWRFATLNFDDTRFFLKQQEKVISDTLKQGAKDKKDVTLFKHAAVLHLVVTVRDLLLTCSLNTAVGYLSKAKDRYKDFVDSSLDNLCRQLTIVHLVCQKKLEANPKTTELQHQILNWMQSKKNEKNKVVIVTRMEDGDETAALINALGTVQGLEVAYLNSEKRGALLESKNIIRRLEICSCLIVYDQSIGPDFPWTRFSLVVEYNYSKNSCWINLCKNMDISYITFVTVLPETVGIEEVSPDDFGHILLEVQIPYVFLTSEGLLNTPDILWLLESKYDITFIERSCCEALQFFGNTDRYVVITIDECTAVIMQNVEELNYEKSSDNVVLRLVVLSLQYSCCWIILYSRARLNSEYSLAGKTLHHLALIYAALVPFSQKSEDFEVKVVLTPGIEETARLVRQIADCVLMTSKRHPQEWLDKSWLSVLPSEAEKCLLTFPCMNPLVAQLMLKKSLSLEWLLSATFDQLQKLLPEVPEKVLKHFSDITSLYTFNPPTEPKCQNGIVSCQEMMNSDIGTCSPEVVLSSVHGHSPFTENSDYLKDVQNCRSYSPAYYQKESCIPLKPNGRHSVMAPVVTHQREMCYFKEMDHSRRAKRQQYLPFLKNVEVEREVSSPLCSFGKSTYNNLEAAVPTSRCNQAINIYPDKRSTMEMCLSKVKMGPNLDVPILLKNPPRQDIKSVFGVRKQPLVKRHKSYSASKHSCYLSSTREDFPFQQNFGGFLGEFGGTAFNSPEFQFEEGFRDDYRSAPTVGSSLHDASFCKATSNSKRLFNMDFQIPEEYTGRKRLDLLSSLNRREQDASAGLEFNQLPQLKKRRLTFEKDPGRSDGQTRLKFF
ncbi:protein shortage in chiasmata 1 ortholog [Eublepharis macularius]|uniref:Protein shortage in chiasmata 1 ortholog n=1 Tax=Eublepharis macularius TaxID=481883 RepID=A0AA97L602_EUBMA|nr:protein shortage in chiasmata 1 ortholog [Eublepharis macularius]